MQVHLVMDTVYQSKNRKSEHQVRPGVRHLTRTSEVGQVWPAAELSVNAPSKGQPLLAGAPDAAPRSRVSIFTESIW